MSKSPKYSITLESDSNEKLIKLVDMINDLKKLKMKLFFLLICAVKYKNSR